MVSEKLIQRKGYTQTDVQTFAFVMSVIICILFSVCFAVSNISAAGQVNEVEPHGRLNPNNAPIASLVRLPRIGAVIAGTIAAYREEFARDNAGMAAFETIADLQNVKGIGPKTAKNIGPWLKFE